MARVVILGGGFGGIACADALAERLPPEHEIVLVERSETFMMGLRKVWIVAGTSTAAEGRVRLDRLRADRVRLHHADILDIDPDARRVTTSKGELTADFLVVALGAQSAPGRVAGFERYDIYSVDGAEAAGAAIRDLDGGRIVIGILGLPYKCPPAPFEFAMVLHEALVERGARAGIELAIFTPQPSALPVAGPAANQYLAAALDERGIQLIVGAQTDSIGAAHVDLVGGGQIPFDMLLGVPPHAPAPVIARSPLAGEGGWVRVDPRTLETAFEGVYAIGDVTHIPLGAGALPKAGVFAEGEGRVVAARIAAAVTGEGVTGSGVTAAGAGADTTFGGEGFCLMEVGAGAAASIKGDFYAEGGPNVVFVPPSEEAGRAKRTFESERLERWFA